ncbi:hypothetical protein QQ008_11560 [Fulvivirgaceae bacterium BMA10]|uniref:Lipocalin-like domain-containing protein n=1 Tax=Splendidivirga corallicola TaxID=3051826 RepID=A0ABT8KQQ1_9BACT|nr:hypothetical protein [Fulvivirgaceae bacterium BMA10]
MKRLLIMLCFALVFVACNEEEKKSETSRPDVSNQLMGTWKMVYGEIRENDSIQIKDLTKSDFIKIINESHFAFFNQDYQDISGFYGGGGRYRLEGDNKYIETLEYTSVEAIRGHNFPFTVEIKGDTLIQYGLEEVKEANIKRHIVEKYIRMED